MSRRKIAAAAIAVLAMAMATTGAANAFVYLDCCTTIYAGWYPAGAYAPAPYGYGAYRPSFDMRDLARYYDRNLYLDSCFVDRGRFTPAGLAVKTINTCYH